MPVDPITTGIGAIGGLVGGIGQMFGRRKANKELEKLIGQNPMYSVNPEAQKRLALAETVLNARMPGAAQLERNIYSNQANQLGRLQRNVTDPSQLLALGATAQAQSNEAFEDLATREAQDYYNRLGNLTGAQQGMIAEGDKVYNDQVRRFNDTVQIRGAQQANKANTWKDISNLGFSLMDFGMAGGFQGMFGGAGNKSLGGMQGSVGRIPTNTGMPMFSGSALNVPKLGI